MRRAHVIAASMLGAVAVSYARALATGTLTTVGVREMLWPMALFGVFAAIAGAAYLTIDPARDLATPSWRRLLWAALAIHLVAALSLPLTASDLWSNVAYGRMAALGHNPYLGGPIVLPAGDWARQLVHPMWIDLPLPYGPLVAMLSMGPGAAPSAWTGMILFKIIFGAAGLATVVLAMRLCRDRFADGEARERFVLFAWCPLFAWEVTGQVHNDAILVLALVGFVYAMTGGRELLAIACLAAGIAAKFVAAPVAGLYLVSIARRRPARAALYGAGLAAVTVASVLPWWHGLSTLSGLWTNIGPVFGHSTRSIGDLVHLAAEPFGPRADYLAFRAFSLVGLAASAAVGLLGIARARDRDSVLLYAILFFLCSDLFAQVWFQPWYVTWLLALALGHPDRRWLRLIAVYAALTLQTYLIPIDPVSNVAIDLYIGWRVLALVRTVEPAVIALNAGADAADDDEDDEPSGSWPGLAPTVD